MKPVLIAALMLSPAAAAQTTCLGFNCDPSGSGYLGDYPADAMARYYLQQSRADLRLLRQEPDDDRLQCESGCATTRNTSLRLCHLNSLDRMIEITADSSDEDVWRQWSAAGAFESCKNLTEGEYVRCLNPTMDCRSRLE